MSMPPYPGEDSALIIEEVIRLIDAVTGDWPEHSPYGGIHDVVVPHSTIAEEAGSPYFNDIKLDVAGPYPSTRGWKGSP